MNIKVLFLEMELQAINQSVFKYQEKTNNTKLNLTTVIKQKQEV